jgi:hypothetical protein
MEHEQLVKVMRSAKGRFVKVITETAPVSPAEMARRIAKAAASVAPDAKAAIPMVKTLSTRQDERGWTISVVQIVGQMDKHYGEDGFHIGKDGGLSFSLVGGAPEEYGFATACPYSGKEGASCEMRGKRHAHRSVRADRVQEVIIAGESFS